MLKIFYKNIDEVPIGKVFSTEDVMGDAKTMASANRLLVGMVKEGKLCRAGRGRYYKPERTAYGQLPVDPHQLVRDLLVQNGKPVGYISGMNALNELGFTTQMPVGITIACSNEKKAICRARTRISFIKQQNAITWENIPVLQLLDCIVMIRRVPDNDIVGTLERLRYLMGQLTNEQRNRMVRLAMKYQPQVRAIVGAIVENAYPEISVESLRKSLNGLTKYKIGVSDEQLTNRKAWHIE